MTKPNIVKKHIATSFHNLSPELQEAVKANTRWDSPMR